MKLQLTVLVTCILALGMSQASASVFAGSGGNKLQSVATPQTYEFIDVADYQTELNNTLMGAVEVDLAPTPDIVGNLGRTHLPEAGNSLLLGASSQRSLPGGEPVTSLLGGGKGGNDGPQTTWWWWWWNRRRWDDGPGGVTPAPEPATWVLLMSGLAAAGLFVSRRWAV